MSAEADEVVDAGAVGVDVAFVLIHFIEARETYAVHLRDEVHAVAVLDDVDGIALLRSGVLAVEVDDVALLGDVGLVEVVVADELAARNIELVGDALHGVALTGNDIDQPIGQVWGVGRLGIVGGGVLPLVGVEAVEVVRLDDVDEPVGIGGVGGIACHLQPACPAHVVGGLQAEEAGIALVRREEDGVVLVGIADGLIDAEAVVARVVVAIDLAPCPVVTLDAEVVVAVARQLALPGTGLQQRLRQRNAGRDVVLLHLVDSQGLVLLDVLDILLVLRSGRKGCH